MINDAHSQAARFQWVGDLHRLPVQKNRAAVWGIVACQDLHQSRLTSAIFTDDRMDLSLVNGEAHTIQRGDTTEMLG